MESLLQRFDDAVTALQQIAAAAEQTVTVLNHEIARLQEENDLLRDKLDYSGEA